MSLLATRISVLVVIAAAAFVVWWLTRPADEIISNTNTTPVNNAQTVVINTNTAAANQNTNAQADDQVAMVRLANLFTERFGSYSSEAEFQNIIDLKKFMTAKMQSWADTYVAAQKETLDSQSTFISITAKVLSTTVNSFSETKSEVRSTTSRTEEGANINGTRTYNQDIVLQLLKQDNDWKVDSAFWQ
jgi:hypothetical protein